VSIGSPDMGTMQDVTDVTRSGETLVLSYEADAQGQFIPVTIRLEPDGDDLAFQLEAGAGEFYAGGKATRAGG
jgi:hypothetical protein